MLQHFADLLAPNSNLYLAGLAIIVLLAAVAVVVLARHLRSRRDPDEARLAAEIEAAQDSLVAEIIGRIRAQFSDGAILAACEGYRNGNFTVTLIAGRYRHLTALVAPFAEFQEANWPHFVHVAHSLVVEHHKALGTVPLKGYYPATADEPIAQTTHVLNLLFEQIVRDEIVRGQVQTIDA